MYCLLKHVTCTSCIKNYLMEINICSYRPVVPKLHVATPWGGAELRLGRRQKTEKELKRNN
jgi:hypothetical protein